MSEKTNILNKDQLGNTLRRLAWEVYEKNHNEKEIVLIGVEKRGVEICNRISEILSDISEINIKKGTIKLDKDNPSDHEIDLSVSDNDLMNQTVILVDDVLSSGKTLMYATKQLLSVSLKSLSVLVLVNRNHNNYPIKADYEGLSFSTTLQEHVNVVLGKNEGVYLS